MKSRLPGKALHLAGLVALLAFTLFPFYWMVSSSLKDQTDLLASPPVWSFVPTLAHYAEIWQDDTVFDAIVNSLIVASCTTLLSVILGTPAAYSLARFQFRGKKDLWFWFISNRMISPIVLALPVYLLAQEAGLLDTHLVLILIYMSFCLPIVVWICTDQFRSIPPDPRTGRAPGQRQPVGHLLAHLPAARACRASRWSAIFSFIFSWNELLYALVLTRSDVRTAPVVATSFMSGYELPWGKIMATGTLIVLPVTIFALFVSRHMVRGLTMGASK